MDSLCKREREKSAIYEREKERARDEDYDIETGRERREREELLSCGNHRTYEGCAADRLQASLTINTFRVLKAISYMCTDLILEKSLGIEMI